LGEVDRPELVLQHGIRNEPCVERDGILGLRDPMLPDEEQDARRSQSEADRGVEGETKDETGRGD
jgi:hypothetical protein